MILSGRWASGRDYSIWALGIRMCMMILSGCLALGRDDSIWALCIMT